MSTCTAQQHSLCTATQQQQCPTNIWLTNQQHNPMLIITVERLCLVHTCTTTHHPNHYTQLQASSLYTTNSISDAVCQSHFNDMVAAKNAIIITVKVCQLLAVINRSTLTVMQTPTCHSLTIVTTAHVQECKYCKQMEELCFHH